MYGLTINWWVDERRDPIKATHAAARYLRDLYNDLGDWHLALAAYNCGPGRVKSAIAKANSRDYWTVRQYLPRETQQYVPLYIAAAKITMDPDAYGFTNINYLSPDEYDTVSLKGAYELSAISQATSLSVEKLKALNPELLRERLPQLGDRAYTLNLPKGAPRDLAARLEDSPAAQQLAQSYITHKVGRGETTSSIAGKYGVSVMAINNANNIDSKTKLRNGMSLRIPMGSGTIADQAPLLASKSNDPDELSEEIEQPAPTETTATAAQTQPSAPQQPARDTRVAMAGPQSAPAAPPPVVAEPRREQVSRPVQNSRSEKASTPQKPSASYHTVSRGESLTSIAKKYGVSTSDLAAWNNLDRNVNVRTGQKLRLRDGGSDAIASKSSRGSKNAIASNDESNNRKGKRPVTTTSTRFETHKIRKGESLSSIADRYGVSVDDLKAWNSKDVKKGSIQAGTSLKIYSETSAKGDTRRSSRAAKSSEKKYTVRKGDSMAEIANKFGVSLKELKKNNPKLTDKSIRPGQSIRIGQ
jgi:membrane-bound lytic murein transglycosylase D